MAADSERPGAGVSAARVLVTDAEERAVLATCRGLARAGYRLSAAATYRPAASHWSRSVDRRHRIADPRIHADAFGDHLEEILRRERHDVLITGTDASLLQVSEQRARFEPLTSLGLPPHDVLVRALDKIAVADAAARVGLGPPESVTCEGETQALAAAERLGYPVVLKPRRSFLELAGGLTQRTSTTVADPEALRLALPRFGIPLTVQMLVSGPVVSFGGVVAEGCLLGLCTSRYGRTWPPGGGSASFTVTIDPPEELVGRVERLLVELGWEGLFELETIELEPGKLASIDFNPRPYGSMILSVASGANLPALWCDHLLGKKPGPRRSRPGVHYRWEEAELRNLLHRLRRGRLLEAAAMVRPYRGTTHAFFEAADPAPVLARSGQLVMRTIEAGRARRAASSA